MEGESYPVHIFLEKRGDSRASIGKRGVSIRLPQGMTREELFREILKMKSWAREEIGKAPQRFRKEAHPAYHNGQEIEVGNEKFVLRISHKEKESSSAFLEGNEIVLSISSGLDEAKRNRSVQVLLSRVIGRRRISGLKGRVERLNSLHFNLPLRKIFFKNNRSNWGSCSQIGNINISTRLLFAPDDVLDYVCIHELAHLREFNHSPAFWGLVEKAMPDYAEKEKWLDDHGKSCRF